MVKIVDQGNFGIVASGIHRQEQTLVEVQQSVIAFRSCDLVQISGPTNYEV